MTLAPPEGTVTFLFTDIEGSTEMWEKSGPDMAARLAEHDRLLRDVFAAHRGYVFTTAGDSFSVAFSAAADAVTAATESQRRLAEDVGDIRIRIGIHTGEATVRDGDYFGPAVNRTARVMSAGHGGQTLVSSTTAAVVRDHPITGLHVVDLGEHILKGLKQPERIFQVSRHEPPASFPPLRTGAIAKTNLPEQMTEFVGREQELAELITMIATSRLVTVLAPGGTGKSRLAIETGSELLPSFDDGVFFVPLAARSSAEELPEAVAEAIGIPSTVGDNTHDQALEYLARKNQLLIMDNFEHLRDGAGFLTEVLERAPGVSVLATSRSRLDLRGESVFHLGGLESTWTSPAEAREASGVRLFEDAAQRRDPRFTIGEADLDDLQRILSSVDGSPLAIELAASWIDVLSVREVADEVAASLDFLESSLQDVPDRHRSIRAVFEYSWNTLSEREQEVFVSLAVFRSGFMRDAAQAVSGAGLRDLAGLAKKSLVMTDPDSGRYSVHELLRQFAEEKLAQTGRHDEISLRHAEYYSSASAALFDEIRSGRQIQAFARTEDDLDNLRAALRFAVKNDAAVARPFIEPLFFCYEVRGWLPGGASFFAELSREARASGGPESDRLAAVLRAAQGWYIGLMGRPDEGLELSRTALSDVVAAGAGAADVCFVQQCRNINLLFLDPEAIADGSEEAISLAEREGVDWWAKVIEVWALYTRIFDPSPDVVTTARSMVEHFSGIGDHWVQVWPGAFLGNLAESTGDFVEARREFERVLGVGREISYGRISEYMLNSLGRVTIRQGDYGEAMGYLTESIAVSMDLGQMREVLGSIVDVARVRIGEQRETEAVTLLAVVLNDPRSAQRTVFGTASIEDLAQELRVELEASLPPADYDAAWQRGMTMTADDAVELALTS